MVDVALFREVSEDVRELVVTPDPDHTPQAHGPRAALLCQILLKRKPRRVELNPVGFSSTSTITTTVTKSDDGSWTNGRHWLKKKKLPVENRQSAIETSQTKFIAYHCHLSKICC